MVDTCRHIQFLEKQQMGMGEEGGRFLTATMSTHRSLHHPHSLLSDSGDGSWDVHHLLFLYLLQNVVNHYKCTCATHTGTA